MIFLVSRFLFLFWRNNLFFLSFLTINIYVYLIVNNGHSVDNKRNCLLRTRFAFVEQKKTIYDVLCSPCVRKQQEKRRKNIKKKKTNRELFCIISFVSSFARKHLIHNLYFIFFLLNVSSLIFFFYFLTKRHFN